jgi:hypothetical protein
MVFGIRFLIFSGECCNILIFFIFITIRASNALRFDSMVSTRPNERLNPSSTSRRLIVLELIVVSTHARLVSVNMCKLYSPENRVLNSTLRVVWRQGECGRAGEELSKRGDVSIP